MKSLLLFAIIPMFLDWTTAIQYYYLDNYCGGTLDISWQDAIRLQLTRNSTYRSNMDCSVVITTSSMTFDRLMLHFTYLDIEYSLSCTRDWLEVRDGRTSAAPYVSGFSGRQCGSYITNAVQTTTGDNLFLRFVSDSTWQSSGFSLVITQYHTGFCYSGEHECSNGRCIPSDVVCNGYNPCGDYSDCDVIIAAGAIAGIVIGGILFAVFASIVVIIFCRRRRRMATHKHVTVNATVGPSYGTSNYGYNQPTPQQYPGVAPPNYPTGQQYPQNYS